MIKESMHFPEYSPDWEVFIYLSATMPIKKKKKEIGPVSLWQKPAQEESTGQCCYHYFPLFPQEVPLAYSF